MRRGKSTRTLSQLACKGCILYSIVRVRALSLDNGRTSAQRTCIALAGVSSGGAGVAHGEQHFPYTTRPTTEMLRSIQEKLHAGASLTADESTS